MKIITKLNAQGAAHLVAIMLVVVSAGIIGTYMIVTSHADTIRIDCKATNGKKGSFKKYNCGFWKTAPVMDEHYPRRKVGTIHAGRNWILCQQHMETFRSGGNYNGWWAYTLADNGKWGWVNGVYGEGGKNNSAVSGPHYMDGSFGYGVPICYSMRPSPPVVYPTAHDPNSK